MGITEIIALLLQLEPLATDAIAYWTKAKTVLSQTQLWTPEYEAMIDNRIANIDTAPEEWQKQQQL